jgi:hypothetical protein
MREDMERSGRGLIEERSWDCLGGTEENHEKTARIHGISAGTRTVNLPNTIQCVIFEVFTAVTMKNGVFWDVMQCGSCRNRRFRGT